MDPVRMTAHDLTPSDIAEAIRTQNIQIAAGTLGQQPDTTTRPTQVTLNAQGLPLSQTSFETLSSSEPRPERSPALKDVARRSRNGGQ